MYHRSSNTPKCHKTVPIRTTELQQTFPTKRDSCIKASSQAKEHAMIYVYNFIPNKPTCCRLQCTIYSRTCLKRPLSERPKTGFKTNYRLTQVKSIAECSPWSIIQSFRPSLSYHLSLRSLFCLILSCHLRQVLL